MKKVRSEYHKVLSIQLTFKFLFKDFLSFNFNKRNNTYEVSYAWYTKLT